MPKRETRVELELQDSTAKSSTAVGNILEENIFQLFRTEIDSGRFWAKKSNCKLHRRKGYFSKDRGSNIIFDVSIEIFLPGAIEYSVLVLVECKNYSHPVPVDDAEEFFAKVDQIGAAKPVIASTAAFQSGARQFAKSKGMGLLRYFGSENFKWELKRSSSGGARSVTAEAESVISDGLSVPNYRSEVFDLFLQSPTRDTNSLWDFFTDLVHATSLTEAQVRKISNSRIQQRNQVPFREKGDLEASAEAVLDIIEYGSGPVSLDAICLNESRRVGLKVETLARTPCVEAAGCPLGTIEFEPLRIQLFSHEQTNLGRDRFTLAHELGHHLLGHGNFMVREYCDENDFTLKRRRIDDGSDIARLEYQANYFAACLLMPRVSFAFDFRRALEQLAIRDKGFGPLYVDDQQCNIQNFRAVLLVLAERFQVSQAAAAIRLESLGLLRDARTQSVKHIRAGLTSLVDAVQ